MADARRFDSDPDSDSTVYFDPDPNFTVLGFENNFWLTKN